MRSLFLWISTFLAWVPGDLHAGNIGFLPSDAFFHTQLRQADCEKLLSDAKPRVSYFRPDWVVPSFCGYYGYMELELSADSKPIFEQAHRVYKEIREFQPKRLVEVRHGEQVTYHEMNGLHLFVYNESFSPLQNYVALRYNESWVEDLTAFGIPRPQMQLEAFDRSHEAWSIDWRDSKLVPPLKTQVPDVQESLSAIRGGKAVAKCDGPIQFIIWGSEKLPSFVNPRQNMTFFSITTAGVKKYEYLKREWKVEDWQPERPDGTP